MVKIHQILTESNWCRHYAELPNGQETYSLDENAVKRCLVGWIIYVYRETSDKIVKLVQQELSNILGPLDSISDWNDTVGFEEVLELCKRLDI